MFGILRDIAEDIVKTAKTVDNAAASAYKDAKETADEMGVGPESVREGIEAISELFGGGRK